MNEHVLFYPAGEFILPGAFYLAAAQVLLLLPGLINYSCQIRISHSRRFSATASDDKPGLNYGRGMFPVIVLYSFNGQLYRFLPNVFNRLINIGDGRV